MMPAMTTTKTPVTTRTTIDQIKLPDEEIIVRSLQHSLQV